jgi:hypothetical protein
MSDPEILEVILNKLEELDDRMTLHNKNCYKCSNSGPCDIWIHLVQDWNYYFVGLNRETRQEIPNYETN